MKQSSREIGNDRKQGCLKVNEKIKGRVVKGMGLASKLGYKTANIDYFGDVAEGVYSALVDIADLNLLKQPAMCYLSGTKLEIHILNYDGNLLDKLINVKLLKFIRSPLYFDTEDKLIEQINKDYSQIYEVFYGKSQRL